MEVVDLSQPEHTQPYVCAAGGVGRRGQVKDILNMLLIGAILTFLFMAGV
jgi:hypothetical protein